MFLIGKRCYVCSQYIPYSRRSDSITCSKACRATLGRRKAKNNDWSSHIPESHKDALRKHYSKDIERVGVLFGHVAVILILDIVDSKISTYQLDMQNILRIVRTYENTQ